LHCGATCGILLPGMNMSAITITVLDKKDLDRVRPLWEELNSLHKGVSTHFAAEFAGFSFEERKQRLLGKDKLLILLCVENSSGRNIGYSIASITKNGEGELDSIYIKPAYRKEHMGSKLMKKSLEWFAQEKITNIEILVAHGNEQVLPFYQKFGFFPRTYKLKRKS
jgi:ribosomal protein S18 acetylase RimI-like enzyme